MSATTKSLQALVTDQVDEQTLPIHDTREAAFWSMSNADAHPEARYQFLELLGSGGFGSVFHALDTWSGEEVAIKVANMTNKTAMQNRSHLTGQMNELNILQAISARCAANHVACVRDHYFQTPEMSGPGQTQLVIVMEYVPGNTLREFDPIKHTRAEMLSIAMQLFEAVRFLHSLNIKHRDIKPDNLIWHNGYLTLVDFGLACRANECRGKSGTKWYVWPRLFITPDADPSMYKASDLYAAARTMQKIVTREWSDPGMTVKQTFSRYPELSHIMSQVMRRPDRTSAGRVLQKLRALQFKPDSQL